MTATKFLVAALTVAASLAFAGPSQAISVSALTLYNTGVDDSGSPLAPGAVDLHYTLIDSPDVVFNGPEAFVTNNGFPIGAWIVNSATSKWISPRPDAGNNNASGQYTYRTTFDLTGFDPDSALINGLWTSDNNGVDILVNGVSTGNTTAFEYFRIGFMSFTLDDHFVAGINTIDFVVNNGTAVVNPTGLRVELSGTAVAMPVPEPGTWAMLVVGLGLVGLGTARNRSKRIVP